MKQWHINRRKACLIAWTLFCLTAGFAAAIVRAPLFGPEPATIWADPGTPGSFSKLAKKASPSVVNISAVKVRAPLRFHSDDPFKEFFERFFGQQFPKSFKQKSLGTGFIIDKEGHILTNNHVVEGTEEIKVKLDDNREFEAKIIGRDPKTDLALIRIQADRDVTPLPLGDSDALEVGDWVVAIGNPFALGHTVTAGIVSAKYRRIGPGSYDNFIQTDASINPGNSGGPLLNTDGRVVGINTAIFTRSGGSIGIGFAIPVNMAKELLPQLKKGKVVRGWLGVMIQTITADLKDKLGLKEQKGALVADVVKGGPAEKAGIKRGDVIVSFDGKEIREMRQLPRIVGATRVGKTVEVEVIRGGSKKTFEVKIGELKEREEPEEPRVSKPNLGMIVEELTPQLARNLGLSRKSGLVVVRVEPGSPAEEADLRPRDIILEIDQVPVKNMGDFQKKMEAYKKGDTILFVIEREGTTQYRTLRVQD
jgi:serine protease Do